MFPRVIGVVLYLATYYLIFSMIDSLLDLVPIHIHGITQISFLYILIVPVVFPS